MPSTLAVEFAQRSDSFTNASNPKPYPYYRVRIKSDGTDGYISLLVVWVPSKHLFRMKEYVTPPLAAYWRTGNKAYEATLTRLARTHGVEPFPASQRYK